MIYDNGNKKVPENILNNEHPSLGIELIKSLVEQIEGSIKQMPTKSGLKISLTF